MSSPVVVVPMRCEALVVNPSVTDAARIWRFEYDNLADFKTPEPTPAETTDALLPTGVYLHWTLPAAFRQGRQDPVSGAVGYDLVPNRWLVVRVQGTATRTATAFVLESDCPVVDGVAPGDPAQSSRFMVDPAIAALWARSTEPHRRGWTPPGDPAQPPVVQIGVRYPLAGWSEKAAEAMFLTAVAPANPAFTGYFPHHVNVFGIHDDLADVPADDTLSYYVVGWHSDPAQDPAGGWKDAAGFAALLDRWSWSIADKEAGPFGGSVCAGACFALPWRPEPGAPAPAPDPLHPESGDFAPGADPRAYLDFGVGNTTIDAFTSLVSPLLAEDGVSTLLRAFSYDQLALLNQVNGAALLDQRIRREWFSSTSGGYRWTVVERSSDGKTAAALTPGETRWLQQLNDDQASLDAALADAWSMQWTLNALWFKHGYLADADNFPFPMQPPAVPTLAQLAEALDPAAPGSAAAVLVTQLGRIQAILPKVSQPDWSGVTNRSDAFAAGIARFATAGGLDPTRYQLKALPAGRYFQAGNPVVVISGVQPPYDADPTQPLTVRLAGQVVTAFSAGGKPVSRATAAAAFPALPNLGSLPAVVAPLLDELLLLDPASAASLAAAAGVPQREVEAVLAAHPPGVYTGGLPEMELGPWGQPWAPLFLEWAGEFLPVGGEASGNWSFDGTDYHLTGPAATPPPQRVAGRSLLSPHAQFLFGSRLETFIDRFGAGVPELKAIHDDIQKVYDWRFLAQELVGFNESLSARDHRTFRRPLSTETLAGGARIADLIGYDDPDAGPGALPPAMRGRVTTVPVIPDGPAIPFQGVREGQFYFTDLYLYDRFGRKLVLVSSVSGSGLHDFATFPAVVDPALLPVRSLREDVTSVVELPPRILQPARLDVQLVDRAADGTLLSEDAAACPVCAWVIPNHLNGSLLLFGADGSSWGDVRLVVGLDGVTRTAEWNAPLHGAAAGTITSLDDLRPLSPHLVQMLESPAFVTEAAFTAFLSAIDASLWTIDPLGGRADQNLSVLVGRPLALVRMRLQFQLLGQPRRDTGWDATFDASPPAYLAQQFAVRLGDQATRQDGTIGYFAGSAYDTFNSVAAPDTTAAQGYVRQIGPPGAGGGGNYLHLPLTDASYAFATVLLDPRAAVHASTGILPVLPVSLPARFVDVPLSSIEIGFRMGPILTVLRPTPAQGGAPPAFPSAVTLPRPVEQGGAWSWWEAGADAATGYDLIAATSRAQLLPGAASLREGVLTFLTGLGGTMPPPSSLGGPRPAATGGGGEGSPAPSRGSSGDDPAATHANPKETMEPTTNPLLLGYAVSSTPQPLLAGQTGTVSLGVAPITPPAYCDTITLVVKVGSDPDCPFTAAPSATASPASWAHDPARLVDGRELGLDDGTYASVKFYTTDASAYDIDYPLVLGLEGDMNATPGTFTLYIDEHAGKTSDPSSFTHNSGTRSMTSETASFFVASFIATAPPAPGAPAAPTVPCTEFANGDPITLQWEGNATSYQLFRKGEGAPFWSGSGTHKSHTVTGGIATDTTFVLVATMTAAAGDPVEIPAVTTVLYDALTLTVSNPDLTPRTVVVAQTLEVDGGATLNGGATVSAGATVNGGATISGGVTINGDAAAAGALTVAGLATLAGGGTINGSAAATGPLTVTGLATFNGGATINGAQVNGDLAATGFTTLQSTEIYQELGVNGALGVAQDALFSSSVTVVDPQVLCVGYLNDAGGQYAVQAQSPKGFAMMASAGVAGNLTVQGALYYGGSVVTRLATRDSHLPATPPLSLRHEIHLSGSARLSGGRAAIAFDDAVRDVIAGAGGYRVLLTAGGDCRGLCAMERGAAGFAVVELQGGRADVEFDWFVVAPRAHAPGAAEARELADFEPFSGVALPPDARALLFGESPENRNTAGTAHFTQVDTRSGPRAATSPLSLRVEVQATGSARLGGGRAFVAFEDAFADLILPGGGYRVLTTPLGRCGGLHVVAKEDHGFMVESGDAGAGVEFDWMVVAEKRSGLDSAERHEMPAEFPRVAAAPPGELPFHSAGEPGPGAAAGFGPRPAGAPGPGAAAGYGPAAATLPPSPGALLDGLLALLSSLFKKIIG